MTDQDSNHEVDQQLAAWLNGGSAVPLLDLLVGLGSLDQAACYARLALADDDCLDRQRVESILERIAEPPDGWTEAVLSFAKEPSVEAWEQLMAFTPFDVFYHRTRNTIGLLQRLGTDANILFQCATRFGTTPDAIGLAESGEVDPEVIAHRAAEVPAAAGLWLGLAAQAAMARGDRFGVVRYLREAFIRAHPDFPPTLSVFAIRDQADDELQELLDSIGVPRL